MATLERHPRIPYAWDMPECEIMSPWFKSPAELRAFVMKSGVRVTDDAFLVFCDAFRRIDRECRVRPLLMSLSRVPGYEFSSDNVVPREVNRAVARHNIVGIPMETVVALCWYRDQLPLKSFCMSVSSDFFDSESICLRLIRDDFSGTFVLDAKPELEHAWFESQFWVFRERPRTGQDARPHFVI